MTALVARIVLAVLMFPLAFCLGIAMTAALGSSGILTGRDAFIVGLIATGTFVILYWLLLWHRSIRWTNRRVTQTLVSIPGCALAGVMIGVIVAGPAPQDEIGVFIGGAVAVSIWLTVTVLIWRETTAERVDRIRRATGDVLFCPKCGYNMTGLHEARCPECGTRFTLDQLVAAQKQDQLDASS